LTAQHPPRWIKFAADAHAASPCLDAQARFFFFFLIRENTRAILGGRRAESRGDARRAGSSRIGIINFTSRLINVNDHKSDLITIRRRIDSLARFGRACTRAPTASARKEKRDDKERPMNRGTGSGIAGRRFFCNKEPFVIEIPSGRSGAALRLPVAPTFMPFLPFSFLLFLFFFFSSANCIAWMIPHAAISRARGLIAADTSVMDL